MIARPLILLGLIMSSVKSNSSRDISLISSLIHLQPKSLRMSIYVFSSFG